MQGRVTSLSLSHDHLHLLSCSRDNTLKVIDLRVSNIRQVFRYLLLAADPVALAGAAGPLVSCKRLLRACQCGALPGGPSEPGPAEVPDPWAGRGVF